MRRRTATTLEPLVDAVRACGLRARAARAIDAARRRGGPRRTAAVSSWRSSLTLPVLVADASSVPDAPAAMWLAWALDDAGRCSTRGGRSSFAPSARPVTGPPRWTRWSRWARGAAYGYSACVGARPDGVMAQHYFDTAAVIITLILVGKMLEARARGRPPATPLGRCSNGARRRRRVLDRTARSGRSRSRTCTPGNVVVVRPGEKIPADGVVKDGRVVGRSVDADGRVGAGRRRTRRRGRRRRDQRSRPAGGVRHEGRREHEAVRDRPAARVGAGVEGARPAARRPDLVRLRADRDRRSRPRRSSGGSCSPTAGAGHGAAPRGGRAADRVSVRARARDARRHHGRHGARRGARACCSRAARSSRRRAARGHRPARQDRHGHRGRDDAGGGRSRRRRSTADEVLALAAAAESGSEHPIARAVVEGARERGSTMPDGDRASVRARRGCVAPSSAGAEVRVGRPEGLPARPRARRSSAWRAEGSRRSPSGVTAIPVGLVAVADRVKPEAADAVARLRRAGARASRW